MFTIDLRVNGAFEVVAKDLNGKSDPYHLIGWSDSTGTKFDGTPLRSTTCKKTVCPFWTMSPMPFAGDFNIDSKSKILVQLWDEDTIGKDEFLGQVILDLTTLEQTTKRGAEARLPLTARPGKKEKVTGELWIWYIFYVHRDFERAQKEIADAQKGILDIIGPACDTAEIAQEWAEKISKEPGFKISNPSPIADLLASQNSAHLLKKLDWFVCVQVEGPLDLRNFDKSLICTDKSRVINSWGPALFELLQVDQSVPLERLADVLTITSTKATDEERSRAIFRLFDGVNGRITLKSFQERLRPLAENWIACWKELPMILMNSALSIYMSTLNASAVIDHVEKTLKEAEIHQVIAQEFFRVAQLEHSDTSEEAFVAAVMRPEVRAVMSRALDEVAFHFCCGIVNNINTAFQYRATTPPAEKYEFRTVRGRTTGHVVNKRALDEFVAYHHDPAELSHPRVHFGHAELQAYFDKCYNYKPQHGGLPPKYRDFVPYIDAEDPPFVFPIKHLGDAAEVHKIEPEKDAAEPEPEEDLFYADDMTPDESAE